MPRLDCHVEAAAPFETIGNDTRPIGISRSSRLQHILCTDRAAPPFFT
jgi:hypothetical protein